MQGIDATLITIEVNSSRGCMFYLVGLPDSAVKESHQRIISALQVNGYRIPTSNIIINMAPADIRKEGSAYDLPLAIGMLAAGGSSRSYAVSFSTGKRGFVLSGSSGTSYFDDVYELLPYEQEDVD